jgi:hypothetical protein
MNWKREDLKGRFALTADPGALQVAFPDGPRPLGFLFGVHAKDDPRRLCPICTLGAGIEEPQSGCASSRSGAAARLCGRQIVRT